MRVAVISAHNYKRQRRKRQSLTAKQEKSQTPKVLTAILTLPNLYELWRLRLSSFGGYGLALAALALVVFGAIECPPKHAYRSYSPRMKLIDINDGPSSILPRTEFDVK